MKKFRFLCAIYIRLSLLLNKDLSIINQRKIQYEKN